MTLRFRAEASADVRKAAEWYLHHAGASIASGFLDAIDATADLIAAYPASGSLRHAGLLRDAELRVWKVARFPYLLFVVSAPEGPTVIRVLHTSRDVRAVFGPLD